MSRRHGPVAVRSARGHVHTRPQLSRAVLGADAGAPHRATPDALVSPGSRRLVSRLGEGGGRALLPASGPVLERLGIVLAAGRTSRGPLCGLPGFRPWLHAREAGSGGQRHRHRGSDVFRRPHPCPPSILYLGGELQVARVYLAGLRSRLATHATTHRPFRLAVCVHTPCSSLYHGDVLEDRCSSSGNRRGAVQRQGSRVSQVFFPATTHLGLATGCRVRSGSTRTTPASRLGCGRRLPVLAHAASVPLLLATLPSRVEHRQKRVRGNSQWLVRDAQCELFGQRETRGVARYGVFPCPSHRRGVVRVPHVGGRLPRHRRHRGQLS